MVIDKSWNMENWHDQSQNLPIFSTNLIKFVLFLLILRNLALIQKLCIFRPFLQNVVNDGQRNLRNGHGNSVGKKCKVSGNPVPHHLGWYSHCCDHHTAFTTTEALSL